MEYGESVTKIDGDYPDTNNAVYTGTVEADNVASISLNEHETGYLAGMLAASMSKTGKIGVIIGSDLPPMIRIAEAYKLGAKEVNPDIQVFEGRIASGDQFVCDQGVKDNIVKEFSAYAVEMEGAAIGQAAALNGIPFLIIRAISDKADNSANMDYPAFEKLAIEHSVRLTQGMLKRMA